MVDILLSTYNGEKYVVEQIDSILNQSFSNWQLIIRDDGSVDNTLNIIDDYCKRFPNKIRKITDAKGNVGVIRSFEILLGNTEAEYIMFCDQDDLWLSNKIEDSLDKMKQMESQYGNIPLLVHTDLIVVDKNRDLICKSFWQYSALEPEILDKNIYYLSICNCITGCTVLINKKAKEVSLPFVSPIEMHDVWIALHVKKYGEIDYLDIPTIEYRQHGLNQYGAKPASFSIIKKILNIKTIIQKNRQKYQYYHPFVFKSVFQYLYYKIKYFFVIRFYIAKK
jgi:glycosyltransferase involved in cell wall biosynthesis